MALSAQRRLALDGYYELTPAYDVVPTLQNLGYPQMVVGREGAASSVENALTELREFGIQRARATELIRQVARVVDGWQDHFVQQGVCRADMALLQASIDRNALKAQRVAFL